MKKILNVFMAVVLVLGLASVAWATTQSIIATPSSMRGDGLSKVVTLYSALTKADDSTSWAQETTHYLTHNYKSAVFQVHAHAITGATCYLRVDGSSDETNWSTLATFSWSTAATTQVSSLVTNLTKYVAASVYTDTATMPCAFVMYGTFRQ